MAILEHQGAFQSNSFGNRAAKIREKAEAAKAAARAGSNSQVCLYLERWEQEEAMYGPDPTDIAQIGLL